MPNVLCRLPNHVGDCCMTLPALRLLEASGFTPMLTGKRWAEDLMSGMGWRFDPIEGHVTEDLHRIRYISNHLGPRPAFSEFLQFGPAFLHRARAQRGLSYGWPPLSVGQSR